MDSTLEAKLRVMLDKQEIHDLLMRYARGIDRGDAELVASVYHPDAVDDHGGILVTGPQAAKMFTGGRTISGSRKQIGQHFMGNEYIEVDGDTAYGETYTVSFNGAEQDGQDYTRARGLRYLDRFERRNGEWKIAFRVVVDDWDTYMKTPEGNPGWEKWRRGNIREKDPSATFRKGELKDSEKEMRKKLGV